MKTKLVLFPLLLMCGTALAQSLIGPVDHRDIPNAPVLSGSNGQVVASAQVFNIHDFGAICDGAPHPLSASFATLTAAQARYPYATSLTDELDGVAIGNTFDAARATVATAGQKPIKIVSGKGYCRSSISINATNLRGEAITVDFGGAVINSTATGVAFDALGSQRVRFRDITINGAGTVGFQLGRTDIQANNSSDDNSIEDVIVDGNFSLAAVYNVTSETTKFDRVFARNGSASTTAYALVQDGLNHFGATSQFVTQLAPTDTPQSFNENVFLNCDFRTTGGAPPIWMANTARHKFIASYAANVGGGYGVALYQANGAPNLQPDFDVHFETNALTDVFFITGPLATPEFDGFAYKDHSSFPSNSVFQADSGITAVTMNDADIRIAGFRVPNTHLFDNAALWAFHGRVYLPTAASWTAPAALSGEICVAGQCTPLAPTYAINRNPDFDIDQPNAGAVTGSFLADNDIVIDGWHVQSSGTVKGKVNVNHQRDSNAPPTAYTYSLKSNITAPYNPAAVDSYVIRTMIEATDIASLGWGAAGAQPLTVDFCAKANNAGNYAAFIQNNGSTRSYVFTYPLGANAWSCFSQKIPGDVAGSWGKAPSTIGAFIGFSLAAGLNFQTSAGAWGAGKMYASSSTFNFFNTSGATLAVGAVHVYLGPYQLPYQKRPYLDELARAKRYYTKSFAVTVKPAQNSASSVGAITLQTPYAQATLPRLAPMFSSRPRCL